MATAMYSHSCGLLTLLAVSSHRVYAAPAVSRVHRRQQEEGKGSSMSIGPTIWIPLVVIGVLFVVGVTLACGSRHFRKWSNWGTGAAQAAGASTGTTPTNARELTADQLAGTNATTTAGANGGTNRARRPRRARRTPSQISTHSLPAYNKEPGEQEIVIVRGAEDMEDMPVPITVTMPVVDEHGTDTPDGSFDLTRPSSDYVAMPESPNDEPLLQNSEHSPQYHLNVESNESATRRSFDSAMSSDENAQLHYTDDAPPYEAVALDGPSDLPRSPPSSTAPSAGTQQAPAEQPGTGSTRRRSMFMSIFNPRNSRIANPPVPTNAESLELRTSSHTRDGSDPSIVSLAASERDPRPRSRARHRPSQSGSGSMLSLLSRTRSNNNLAADRLTSPSMISLNSISSPLSHTLVRTDFTYPKSGPTPEQLKLISSRESFARFGVPYGRDAIAFAASSSRIDLEPPPGFEEVAGTSGAADSSSAEGNDSSSSLPPAVEEATEARPNLSDGDAPASAVGTEPTAQLQTTEAARAVSHNDADVSPSADSTSAARPSASLASVDPAPTAASPSLESTSPSPPTMLSPLVTTLVTSSTSSNPPPSAFKSAFNAGSLPTRTASRASSYMSFATAEDSLPASEPPTPGVSHYDLHANDDAYESAPETPVNGSAPTTPRIETRHLHETTDTTITPDR